MNQWKRMGRIHPKNPILFPLTAPNNNFFHLLDFCKIKINRYGVPLIFSAFPILFSACQQEPPAAFVKPNIIMIMADDLGYGGISCYGEPNIETPELDALAKNGIRFTDFHSNAPACTPTRAAFLTGKYQQRSGLEGVIYVRGETREVGLDTSIVTLPKLLRGNGYTTGIMGKWHLGYRPEFNPVNHGFDEFYGFLSGNIDYHSHYDNAGIYDWWHNLDTLQEEGYTTDLITRHSVDFIDKHKDKPFFLFVSHGAPHVPFQGRKDPAYRFPGEEFTYYGPAKNQKEVYKEMVEVMDEGIGKLMEALKKYNLEENTLVFFFSDNGAEAFGNNGKLSGQKLDLLEGGHRVPAIAYWKNRIMPAESSETLLTMDLMPTILSITNTIPQVDQELDGVDFSEVLLEGSNLENRTIFWRYQEKKAVRENNWKLLVTEKDTLLFDLISDLRETEDLSNSQEKLKKELMIKLVDWEMEVGPVSGMKTQ